MLKLTDRIARGLAGSVLLFSTCIGSAFAEDFDSNGVNIHYSVHGSGQPVILLHGLSSSARMNWELPGIESRLAQTYEVIALDERGHGQSGKPKGVDQYGTQMVEDVVRLMDHLHVHQAHIVGYSLGGIIAMKLMTMYPQRVSSAVLGGMGWLREGSVLRDIWANMGSGGRFSSLSDVSRGTAQLATTEAEVKAIRVPVAMIVGDRDPTRRMYVEPLHNIRPEWPIYEVAGAGHMTCVTKSEFKDDLEKVLASQSKASPSK